MADQSVRHNLNVTGYSEKSFDDAVKNAINGANNNHGEEYIFKSFSAYDFDGSIGENLKITYSVTVKISAIHREHNGHGHDH